MKRAIKIIVPLLLAGAILFSIGWYFLEYDPDFTRDLLLQQARRFEKNGNLTAAVWFYDLAYQQSKDNDLVAIELADQFKNIGNYTKAEYTLSKAIEDGGTVELYTALCKTYVEQNKLLDAVQMLDKITDPAMKQALDALRPATPVPSLEPGHYSQYLTVSVEAATGALYISTDKEYPSLQEDAYQEPVQLTLGDTTIWALSVADNGLVSPLGSFVYTVSGVIEPVTFQDPVMEAEIRALLKAEPEQVLMSNDLWAVTTLAVPSGVTTLADLKWMPYLETLIMKDTVIDSLSHLQGLGRLNTLGMENCVFPSKDLEYVGKLPALKTLQLSGCGLSSIKGLEHAVNLESLNLNNNTIRDISALTNMANLKNLAINHNALVSLDAIAQLTKLEGLDVSHNAIVSTAPLANLTGLAMLSVSGNGLMQLEGIENLTALHTFEAAENKLVDISVLAGCTQMQRLDVSNNTLLDISVVSGFSGLQELIFSHNEVASLPGFAPGCPLTKIDGSYNQLSSLDALSGLQALEYVFMDYNGGISSVYPLANCPALKLVNVYRTAVTSVSVLTDRGVSVNFSPV